MVDLIGNYKNTFLGIFWNIIFPLLSMLVYWFVFGVMLKVRANEEQNIPFFMFVFSGFFIWFTFGDSVLMGKNIFIGNSNYLKKANFPKKILLYRIGLFHLIKQGIILFIFLIFYFFMMDGLYKGLLWLPLIMILEMMFCYSLNLIISSLTPFFRDLSFIIDIILRVMFYMTFILYPVTLIQDMFPPTALLYANPVASFVILVRHAVFENYNNYPFNEVIFLSIFGWTFVMMIVGNLVFRSLKNDFVDIL